MFWTKTKVNTDPHTIENLLSRGVEGIFPDKETVRSRLLSGKQLKIYLGVDPTGPTLHIGHLIPILKLAELQRLGHKIIFLIGDFTATIGDPTNKLETRKTLTYTQTRDNAKAYKEQISKFIDFDGSNKAVLKWNSSWLGNMGFADVLKLASRVTVDQMLKRDMFAKRREGGGAIFVHEFMYPLMQGYDSVALDVDGEVGGNDQTFNMLVGRDLLRSYKNKDKFVLATKLITDAGGKKMGKSEGNMVSLNQDPKEHVW